MEILREMWNVGFARDIKPFSQDQRDALARLTRAYGINPERVSLWQMWTLWTEGPDKVIRMSTGQDQKRVHCEGASPRRPA